MTATRWAISLLSLVFAINTVGASELPFGARTVLDAEYDDAIAVAIGDLDGDGLDDIVVAATTDSAFSWWRSLGDGTFTQLNIATGVSDLTDVEVADLNSDGHLDVVVSAAGGTDAVGWYINDGDPTDGGWALGFIATAFDGAYGVAVGDFDGDGDPDVVGAAFTDGEVAVALNANGLGTAWTYEDVDVAFVGGRSVAVADIDRDGDLDVAGASSTLGELAWWERDHDTGVWSKHPVAWFSGAFAVEPADMDGDGDPDIVGGAAAAGSIRWWANDGNGGGWAAHDLGTSHDFVYAVPTVDLDQDGDLDVAFSSWYDDDVGWWENTTGDGTVWSVHLADGDFNGAMDVAPGDVDGDGDLDLVAVTLNDDDVAWWENESIHRSALFDQQDVVGSEFNDPEHVVVADMDGDGDLDVLSVAETDEDVAWFDNLSGDGSSWTERAVDLDFVSANSVLAADLDGDGDTDVAGSGQAATDSFLWWENTDGVAATWTRHVIGSATGSNLLGGDLDGDGDTDLVLIGGAVNIYENNLGELTPWIPWPVDGSYSWPASIDLADMDADGDLDILACQSTAETVIWFENDGVMPTNGDPWAQHTVSSGRLQAHTVLAGDMDGDGDSDVVAASNSDHLLLWWANNGDGTWSEATIADPAYQAQHLSRADLDNDGDLDLVQTALGGDELFWWDNAAGDGSSWTVTVIEPDFGGCKWSAVGDVDGDGDVDVLALSAIQDLVSWWPNRGGQFALATTVTVPAAFFSGTPDDVLALVMTHRGEVGDNDARFASLELLFEESAGTPLTSPQAEALIDGVWVYADEDDNGIFDSAVDAQVGMATSLPLNSGALTVPIVDSVDAEVAHGVPRRFFVVMQLAADGHLQTPDHFRVTHLTSVSTAVDAVHDTPLLIEHAVDVSTGTILPPDPLIFEDGFETGATTRWSATVL